GMARVLWANNTDGYSLIPISPRSGKPGRPGLQRATGPARSQGSGIMAGPSGYMAPFRWHSAAGYSVPENSCWTSPEGSACPPGPPETASSFWLAPPPAARDAWGLGRLVRAVAGAGELSGLVWPPCCPLS